MLRRPLFVAFAVFGLHGLEAVGALAKAGPPPPDATPGAVGFQ
jgi:hypothetical protein